jgi:hypothetical protein
MAERHCEATDQRHHQQQATDHQENRVAIPQHHDHDHRRQRTDHRQETLER